MDRLISQFEVIRAIEKFVDNIFTKNMGDLINDIKTIPSAEPTDVDETLRILDAINSSGRLDYSDYCELHDAISMISVDKDEWVKRSNVLRIIDKRVNETLAEPYKGMTNGEVIKTVFDVDEIQVTENTVIVRVKGSFCAKMQFLLDWWNSLYEPQESEEQHG